MNHSLSQAVMASLIAFSGVSMAATPDVITSANAHVDQLRYRLVDLDPNDGVTPWITFAGFDSPTPVTALSLFQRDQARSDGIWGNEQQSVIGTPFSAGSGQVSLPNGLVNAGKTNNSFSVSTSLKEDVGSFTGEANEGAEAYAVSDIRWVLSPKTALIVEGQAVLNAHIQTDPFFGVDAKQQYQDFFMGSGASLYTTLQINNEDGLMGPGVPLDIIDTVTIEAAAMKYFVRGTGEPTLPTDDNKEQAFSLTVSNIGNMERAGRFFQSVSSTGNFFATPLPAVPEPSTWALNLLGLGAIGLCLRRRRA
jgi:hypothetical protein